MVINTAIAATKTLHVGTAVNPIANQTYVPIFEDFEKESGIKIIRVRLEDIKLLDDNNAWFAPNGNPIDIINGQATSRLYQYYQQEKLLALNKLWQQAGLEKDFSHLSHLVTFNDKILGLPYDSSGWQLLYLKSVFDNNIKPPHTIDELVTACQKLHQQGVVPFHITQRSEWNHMIWFEYILLRTAGLDYFYQLMHGQHSYLDDEVIKALTIWQKLITANCFSDHYGNMDWKDVIPFFLRKKVGMLFTGNSLLPFIHNPKQKADIGYLAFPKIADIPRYESAPTNAFSINANTSDLDSAYQFIRFVARPEIQERLTHPMGTIPANKRSAPPSDPYAYGAAQFTLQAAGTSAFIDRILLPEFEIASRPYFIDFLKQPDITSFTNKMEALRKRYYPEKIKGVVHQP